MNKDKHNIFDTLSVPNIIAIVEEEILYINSKLAKDQVLLLIEYILRNRRTTPEEFERLTVLRFEVKQISLKIKPTKELSAVERYIIRNIMISRMRNLQPDIELFMESVLQFTGVMKMDLQNINELRNWRKTLPALLKTFEMRDGGKFNGYTIDQFRTYFRCYIDLALRLTNVPNRSETSKFMIWDQARLSDDPDRVEKVIPEEDMYKGKLIFRGQRFHRIWYMDKVGKAHFPLILPVDNTLSAYLGFFIIFCREDEGKYLYNSDKIWRDVSTDLITFIREQLHMPFEDKALRAHDFRNIFADTFGYATGFNMDKMNDLSLVMRHNHMTQQKHYATGTKLGQVRMALLDHESINMKEGMKLWEAKDKLKFPEIMNWNDFDKIVTERVLWTRLSHVPIPLDNPIMTLDPYQGSLFYVLFDFVKPTTLHISTTPSIVESARFCFPIEGDITLSQLRSKGNLKKLTSNSKGVRKALIPTKPKPKITKVDMAPQIYKSKREGLRNINGHIDYNDDNYFKERGIKP